MDRNENLLGHEEMIDKMVVSAFNESERRGISAYEILSDKLTDDEITRGVNRVIIKAIISHNVVLRRFETTLEV